MDTGATYRTIHLTSTREFDVQTHFHDLSQFIPMPSRTNAFLPGARIAAEGHSCDAISFESRNLKLQVALDGREIWHGSGLVGM